MATKKAVRPKTPNRGAADEREVVKDWAKRYARKQATNAGLAGVLVTIDALLDFLETRSSRTAAKPRGLGRR